MAPINQKDKVRGLCPWILSVALAMLLLFSVTAIPFSIRLVSSKTMASSSSGLARASMAASALPGEILIEILSRLPVKDLLRLKCVCKNWYALISSPSFINAHITKEHLIILNWRDNHPRYDIKLIFCSKETRSSSMNLNFPFSDIPNFVKIVGSCNGLLCISVCGLGTDIFLWNPATRLCRNLPEPRMTIPKGKRQSVCLGFGFDSCTNDYKLVRFLSGANSHVLPERKVELYSKIRDCWRRLDAVLPCRVSENSPSTVVSRGIHWMASRSDDSELIVCFDMGKDLFQEMPLPDSSRSGIEIGKDLAVVNGSLAVVIYPLPEDLSKCIDVWVMKEYGVEESWTKQLRVGPFSGISRPLACFKNGALVLQNNKNKLLLYDSNTRKFEKLPVFRTQYIYDIHTYMESLVSVNGGC